MITILLGSFIAFSQEYGSFIDPRDSNEYQTVKIGEQIWMAENLKYFPTESFVLESEYVENASAFFDFIKPDSNISILQDTGTSNGEIWGRLDIEYENSTKNEKDIMGIFLKINNFPWGWYDLPLALEVCPSGWHLASNDEWDVLVDQLGGKKKAGKKMKSAEGWKGKAKKNTNESGLSIKGGAYYYRYEGGWDNTSNAILWTYTEQNGQKQAVIKLFTKSQDKVLTRTSGSISFPGVYYPVRCIKDE